MPCHAGQVSVFAAYLRTVRDGSKEKEVQVSAEVGGVRQYTQTSNGEVIDNPFNQAIENGTCSIPGAGDAVCYGEASITQITLDEKGLETSVEVPCVTQLAASAMEGSGWFCFSY